MDQMRDTGLSCEAQPFQSADPPLRMELERLGSTERIPAPAEAVPAETDAVPASTDAASQPIEDLVVRYWEQQGVLPLHVVDGSGPSLLGCDWLQFVTQFVEIGQTPMPSCLR